MKLSNAAKKEIAEIIKNEQEFQSVHNCRRCGSCVSTWPSTHRCSLASEAMGVQINCRGLNGVIENIQEGKCSFSDGLADYVWRCVTCYVCKENCSENVNPYEYIHTLRTALVDRGYVPESIKPIFQSAERNGNVWGGKAAERMDWAKGLEIKTVENNPNFEYLVFIGDASAYVPRNQKVAHAFIEILNKLDINYAVLGNEERTSGGELRRLGEMMLFEDIARENIEAFKKYNVQKIIALSAHGYDVLKNNYAELDEYMEDVDVQHYTEFFEALIDDEVLTFTKPINKKVTYHDPCYLGRHNQVYDSPRVILNAIPALEFVEMDHNSVYSICCGGGGGGIWMKRGNGVITESVRYKEAASTGADILAVACPVCMQMFEGERNNETDSMEIKDLIELIYEAL